MLKLTRKKKPRLYSVKTWDTNLGMFTAQTGLECGLNCLAIPLFSSNPIVPSVHSVLKSLKRCGYTCEYSSKDGVGDPSVEVERVQ